MLKIALYRKYRPTCFQEIIAQSFVIKTLKQEIANKNTYHAYIFSGTRGSGKTSVARIMARALNCMNPQDGDCCGKCTNCLATTNTNSLDIYEIDAASNSGVDEIRKLIDTIPYLPTELNKKIYIIDEAHMLSNSAWNALLKTIEEPPAHVCFIFATTEINKIPMTIMSRCQRFDFYQLKIDDLMQLITDVANKENILISNEAKLKIAQLSDGSARDCLSILDQVSSYSNNQITIDQINEIFGLLSLDFKINLINQIKNQDDLGNLIHDIEYHTSNYLVLAKDLIDIVMDKIIYEKTNNINLLKMLSISDIHKIIQPISTLYELLDVFSRLYERIKQFGNGLVYFTQALLQYTNLDSVNEIVDKEPSNPSTSLEQSSQATIENKPNFQECFSTQTITNKFVTSPSIDVANNSNLANLSSPIATLTIDEQLLFNQIVHNEDPILKNKLEKKLETFKQELTDVSLKSLLFCKKVLTSSKNGAILLFDFKNEAKELNKIFWSSDGYMNIKLKLFDGADYILLAGDKNTIRNWRDNYLQNPSNYSDVDLGLLDKIKPISDEEKYLKIKNILGGNK